MLQVLTLLWTFHSLELHNILEKIACSDCKEAFVFSLLWVGRDFSFHTSLQLSPMIGHQFHLTPLQQATCSQTPHPGQTETISIPHCLQNLVISIVHARMLCYAFQCNLIILARRNRLMNCNKTQFRKCQT